jgi:hypothetical protein
MYEHFCDDPQDSFEITKHTWVSLCVLFTNVYGEGYLDAQPIGNLGVNGKETGEGEGTTGEGEGTTGEGEGTTGEGEGTTGEGEGTTGEGEGTTGEGEGGWGDGGGE